MKNLQKGFIVPLLLVIIAVLVVGGGVYIYENKKTETPAVVDTTTQQSNQVQPTTQTPPVTSNQTILNSLVTDWKKIGPKILPGFPAVSQAFYGYPDIIQFIGNNRIVISYQDDFNPLFAVLSYDTNQKQFSYLDGLRSSPFKVSETLWNTWRNKYGDVSFAPQTYQFSSTRTGDVVYSSDWKLITKNPFISNNSPSQTVDWENLLPSMRTALKQAFPNERIEESRSISIYKKVDVTGDGVAEVMVNLGTGGATTDLVTSMRIENGKPIAPLFKQKDGKISTLLFSAGAGGSGRYGSTAEMLANKNAIYSASYSKYGESADYCRVEAYQWNSQTKIFEYNTGLSNEIQQDYCRTAGTGL